jgi:hypothetical protein
MPNSIQSTDVLIDEYEETNEDAADDFTFTLGSDGRLKSFSIPQHFMDNMPDEVQMILELFGIDDIHELHNKTIH